MKKDGLVYEFFNRMIVVSIGFLVSLIPVAMIIAAARLILRMVGA